MAQSECREIEGTKNQTASKNTSIATNLRNIRLVTQIQIMKISTHRGCSVWTPYYEKWRQRENLKRPRGQLHLLCHHAEDKRESGRPRLPDTCDPSNCSCQQSSQPEGTVQCSVPLNDAIKAIMENNLPSRDQNRGDVHDNWINRSQTYTNE
jgi:hypothetical protein